MTFRLPSRPFAAPLILLIAMSGLAMAQTAGEEPLVGAHGLGLPATFTGTAVDAATDYGTTVTVRTACDDGACPDAPTDSRVVGTVCRLFSSHRRIASW